MTRNPTQGYGREKGRNAGEEEERTRMKKRRKRREVGGKAQTRAGLPVSKKQLVGGVTWNENLVTMLEHRCSNTLNLFLPYFMAKFLKEEHLKFFKYLSLSIPGDSS